MTIFNDRYYFSSSFFIYRFKHCNREENKLAHELAKLARFSFISDWFEESLNEIVMILTNDVLVISNE